MWCFKVAVHVGTVLVRFCMFLVLKQFYTFRLLGQFHGIKVAVRSTLIPSIGFCSLLCVFALTCELFEKFSSAWIYVWC